MGMAQEALCAVRLTSIEVRQHSVPTLNLCYWC